MRGRAGASRGRTRPNHAYVSMLRVVYGLIKHRTTAICGRPWALKRSTFHPDPFRLVSTRPFQARARARNRVGFRKSGACPLPGRPRPRGYSPKAPKAQLALRGGLAGPCGVFQTRICPLTMERTYSAGGTDRPVTDHHPHGLWNDTVSCTTGRSMPQSTCG